MEKTLSLAIGFAVVWSAGIAVLLGLAARPVAGLFSDDPLVLHYAALFFWIVPVSYIFSNLVNGWSSAFNAMGMPGRSFLMTVVKMLVCLLPAAWIGEQLGGVPGLFISVAAVNIGTGLYFHFTSRRILRRKTAGAPSP